MGLLSGVNFMLHSCGWLEGGLVSSFEKYVMDADQLGVLHGLAKGIDMSENGQAMDALREVGPGGHFLGCEHTQANYQTAFWRTQLFDYKPFETWDEEGARDTVALAKARVEKMLSEYQAPPIDPAIAEALSEYVAKKKAAEPDASCNPPNTFPLKPAFLAGFLLFPQSDASFSGHLALCVEKAVPCHGGGPL